MAEPVKKNSVYRFGSAGSTSTTEELWIESISFHTGAAAATAAGGTTIEIEDTATNTWFKVNLAANSTKQINFPFGIRMTGFNFAAGPAGAVVHAYLRTA